MSPKKSGKTAKGKDKTPTMKRPVSMNKEAKKMPALMKETAMNMPALMKKPAKQMPVLQPVVNNRFWQGEEQRPDLELLRSPYSDFIRKLYAQRLYLQLMQEWPMMIQQHMMIQQQGGNVMKQNDDSESD